MKVMLLAAGRGERMMPLTQNCPKPMLLVAGKPLIQRHVEKLAAAGIKEIIINLSYLGEVIKEFLGDGKRFGVSIVYSWEEQALETGGGIKRILPLIEQDLLPVINSDIWTEFDYRSLLGSKLPSASYGHLVMVDNPDHHQRGDFVLKNNSQLIFSDEAKADYDCYTFSGIGIYRKEIFDFYAADLIKFPLKTIFQKAILAKTLTGIYYDGFWIDVGTPERIAKLNRYFESDR